MQSLNSTPYFYLFITCSISADSNIRRQWLWASAVGSRFQLDLMRRGKSLLQLEVMLPSLSLDLVEETRRTLSESAKDRVLLVQAIAKSSWAYAFPIQYDSLVPVLIRRLPDRVNPGLRWATHTSVPPPKQMPHRYPGLNVGFCNAFVYKLKIESPLTQKREQPYRGPFSLLRTATSHVNIFYLHVDRLQGYQLCSCQHWKAGGGLLLCTRL
jgi:hypothetical protein